MSKYVQEHKKVQIEELLTAIEQKNNVKIFLAVESGSRAWGFPSEDSDYDIRFLYHHSPEWYITAFQKKDHIDLAMIHDLDAAGWDIGKCLRLLYRSNSSLFEWLGSPIVYRKDLAKTAVFSELAGEVFNPLAVFYHYISLAKKKLSDDKSSRNAKSFLYALRALLCARWVADKLTAPPVLFDELRDAYLPESKQDLLDQVLQEKVHGKEKDCYVLPEELYAWAKNFYLVVSEEKPKAKNEGDSEKYDDVLRKVVLPA